MLRESRLTGEPGAWGCSAVVLRAVCAEATELEASYVAAASEPPTARPRSESFFTGLEGLMPVLPPGDVLGICSSGQHSSAVRHDPAPWCLPLSACLPAWARSSHRQEGSAPG